MKRLLPLILACILLLSGCSREPSVSESETNTKLAYRQIEADYDDVQVESFGTEADGFRLTYPSNFTLTKSSNDYYEFTDSENELSITLSIEENTFTGIPASEYPQAMGLEMYSKMLSDNSFRQDIYVKDDVSCYSIYTLTDESIYCVKYSYHGDSGQDTLIDLLNLEVYGEFSGSDNTDTLMSYAQVYLEDLLGENVSYKLVYNGVKVIDSDELTVFQAYRNTELLCLIAVNSSGVCYVDHSANGDDFVNIDMLIYDTSENAVDRMLYYTMYYYEQLYGVSAVEDSFNLYDPDYVFDGQHLTVYSVLTNTDNLIFIGVTNDGVGFVDHTGKLEFEKIAN